MWRKTFKLIPLLLLLFAVASSIVMVDESEFVIVERFGRINAVYDTAASRGLHFKAPWPIDTARRFDARIQLFDPPGRELFTRDRKNITVDPFVCWRISTIEDAGTNETIALEDRPVVRFFRSLSGSENAEARLDSQLRSVLTAEVGQVELDQMLSVTDSTSGPPTPDEGSQSKTPSLQDLSATLLKRLQQDAATEMGLQIVDARIKRINFPKGNQQAVFERMKSERRKIADRYRSAGIAENQVIKSKADRQYNEIMSRAKGEAEKIRGEAEAEAIRLLSDAHARDPEFFEMMRTLDSYKSILGEKTTLVLSASSNLFQLLTNGLPKVDKPVEKPVRKNNESPQSKPVDVTDVPEPKL